MSATAPGAVLKVDSVEVTPERLRALVRLEPNAPVRTSALPRFRERALATLPGLRRHTCENDAGRSFSAEVGDTETAHLLEHVTVELMALAGSPRSLKAETSWDFAADGRGRYRVAIEYDDDLVALGALKEAVGVVTWLVAGDDALEGSRPDVVAIADRLRALRAGR